MVQRNSVIYNPYNVMQSNGGISYTCKISDIVCEPFGTFYP